LKEHNISTAESLDAACYFTVTPHLMTNEEILQVAGQVDKPSIEKILY